MWQIMANLAPASALLVSPSSLVSSWHSVSQGYMSSRPFKGALMRLCKHGWSEDRHSSQRWPRWAVGVGVGVGGGMAEKIISLSIISC